MLNAEYKPVHGGYPSDHTRSEYAAGFDDGKAQAVRSVSAAIALLDVAGRLRDVGDIKARDLERQARALLQGILEGRENSQHVLKAEGDGPDATDRETGDGVRTRKGPPPRRVDAGRARTHGDPHGNSERSLRRFAREGHGQAVTATPGRHHQARPE